MPPRPVLPSLNTWRHEPQLRHTRAADVSQLVIQDHPNHIYHSVTGQREAYDNLNLQHAKHCITSVSNELGCLDSVVGDRMASGKDNIFLTHNNEFPEGRKVKYANAVCDYRPLKDYTSLVRLTVGVNRLICPGYPSAPAASLLDSKITFNRNDS